MKDRALLFLKLSIVTSVVTLLLKGLAYYLTGSVGLLSDALESLINLAAALTAFGLLSFSRRPPDRNHPFGHSKAEYFSSVIEGTLILLAAVTIGVAAVERIINPHALVDLGWGLVVSASASALNLFTGLLLLVTGKKYRSIALEADGSHLLTDVWTTAGVIAALLVVRFTGWIILDPVIAIAVAFNIIFTGVKLIRRSVSGLMDEALSDDDILQIRTILDGYQNDSIAYHSLYTRRAASRSFIFLHLVMPGEIHLWQAHEITKRIECRIKEMLPDSDVFIHLEPSNDPDSFDDYLNN